MIESITGLPGTTNDTDPSAVKKDPLDREAFLALLVAQLTHQNPLEPQADGEFLAQLAQFSSLESLQDIREDMAALRDYVTSLGAGSSQLQEGV